MKLVAFLFTFSWLNSNLVFAAWIFPIGHFWTHFGILHPPTIYPFTLNQYPALFPDDGHLTYEFDTEEEKDGSEEISGRSPLWKNQNPILNMQSQSISKQGPAPNNPPPDTSLAETLVPSIVMWAMGAGMGLATVVGAGVGATLPNLNSFSLPNFFGRRQGDYQSCTGLSGESGVCSPAFGVCKSTVITARGACPYGSKCCTNKTKKCGDIVKLNNTYWQSPKIVNPSSPCSVTIKLDTKITEQLGPICQVRLDFLTFIAAPPNSEGVCDEDVFQVGGTANKIPSICGYNNDQLMYLTVPSPNSKILLSFKFGDVSAKREWKIKISIFSCNDDFLLAPSGCLQYFTVPLGSFKTFNWVDTNKSSTYQLANQDYDICFRRELVDSAVASTLCFTPSVTQYGGRAFSLSGSGATTGKAGSGGKSQKQVSDCNNDYVMISGGYDPSSAEVPSNVGDRFCGENLSLASESTVSSTICTKSDPFRIKYRTNGDETKTDSRDDAGIGNKGMSLRFDQRIA